MRVITKALRDSARRNIKKAQAKWQSMSHIARARAMPKTKSERWEKLVKGLEKHKDHIKTPEALATWRLGAKGMALTKSFKKGWSKTCKLVKRKGFTRKGSIRVKPSMAAICGWRKV